MGNYDITTQNILNIIETHFKVSETVLIKEDVIKYVINSSNHSTIMSILMKANNNTSFETEQHKRNYLLFILKKLKSK